MDIYVGISICLGGMQVDTGMVAFFYINNGIVHSPSKSNNLLVCFPSSISSSELKLTFSYFKTQVRLVSSRLLVDQSATKAIAFQERSVKKPVLLRQIKWQESMY